MSMCHQYNLIQEYANNSLRDNEPEFLCSFDNLDDVYKYIKSDIDEYNKLFPEDCYEYEKFEKNVKFTKWKDFKNRYVLFEKNKIVYCPNIEKNIIPLMICLESNLDDGTYKTLYRWLEIEIK